MTDRFRIVGASVRHERVPITHHIKTAFGVMKERHAVLLLIEDDKGHIGVGESWVNFPLWAASERVAAFEQGMIPFLEGADVEGISAFISRMYEAFLGPARQSGTIEPMVEALCGVELALWDLAAQRAGVPLAEHLFEKPQKQVRVYASGINSPLPWDLIDAHLDRGVTLFKLKLGFGDSEDRANLEALTRYFADKASLAVDINRGWTVDQALAWLPVLEDCRVKWIEEPLRHTEESGLRTLREKASIPIAGGENVLMPPSIPVDDVIQSEFDILQPDLTKYTPLHVASQLLSPAAEAGKRVIPHFLGSAPGQAASLHFAAGCPDGLVEMDINRNPLRTDIYAEPFCIEDGCIRLPSLPGLGWLLK